MMDVKAIVTLIKLWFAGDRLFTLGWMKGEAARDKVPTTGDGCEYLAWCFEKGVELQPLMQGLEAGARAAIIAAVIPALKQFLLDLISSIGKGK